jgi:Tfp pilus assembly protein PilP
MLSGCQEANVAVDKLLGRQSSVLLSSAQDSQLAIILAKKRPPGEESPAAASEPTKPAETRPDAKLSEGKRKGPGELAPTTPGAPGVTPPKAAKELFLAGRDPFRQPTEILPTECPPSSPLCKFDPAQLKLVGVLQVAAGEYKGMVEDPDGRGYFISPGMQIGRSTVTQINNEGVTLYDHRTRKDIPMRLLREAREGRES